ncbi:complement C3-like [Pelobates fuscus]|uniref:complement C3-like n=1 Tax=Pelobates fuscus TaxID=191477 RepID=UPI002FE477B0
MGLRCPCPIALLFLFACTYAQPPCILITPSVLRLENEETIVVDGQGTAFDGNILIQDFPKNRLTLSQSRISVNGGNGFIGTTKIKIHAKDFEIDPKNKQFVSVKVVSPDCPLEKVVLVSFHSGYIFIQTDKPIYTPKSTVLYRIFTMTNKLQAVGKNVIIEFVDPRNIIRRRELRMTPPSGLISLSHTIPELVSYGVWTISAKYEDTPELNYTANYEVKEYVLPSFEIKIIPNQNFFYVDDKEFTIDIQARYLYGKTVNGHAFVFFSVKDEKNKRGLPDSLRRIAIDDGNGKVSLSRDDIRKSFPNIEELEGHSIHVTVTVITDTGSDLVEAELEDIFIVKSPYKILFTKTSKFFKPGMPFHLTVFVTNPDGSPANRVPVLAEPGNVPGNTQEDGTTRLTLNTQGNIKTLDIKVKTAHTKLPESRQASASMTATAYSPLAGNYLHISIATSELKLGGNANVDFVIRNIKTDIANQINQFTYLILNKGQIMKVGTQLRQPGQNLVTMLLPITEDFIPSFRIVAYYTVVTGATREIVSDSVWVDVVDSCMGTLEVTREKKNTDIIRPSKEVTLTVKADHKATVGLVAVDKGVFVLNSKFKITQKKVWDSVEKSDIGCTPGGGANNEGVFYDAGLALHTTFQTSTRQRSEQFCEIKANRKRRSSVAYIEYKATKASSYNGLLKKCCQDGMQENLMGHSCEHRSRYIQEGKECVDAFLDCCNDVEKKKELDRKLKVESSLERSDEDENFLDYADVTVRTQFPESWLWTVRQMTAKADFNGISTEEVKVTVKDSITTWEVLAVSLSENKGICVSKPHDLIVFQDFFIDLKLPYSVVRNEQVEIRAILYNYGPGEIKVQVEFLYQEKFCSLSNAKKNYRQLVTLLPESSRAVPFIIVPLELGEHDVEVRAAGAFGLNDGVRKKLNVVPEGLKVTENLISVTLEPEIKGKDGIQQEKVSTISGRSLVPNTDVDTIITLQGTPISQMVEDAINGLNLNHLIVMPHGCGEQNMMFLAPALIAIHYLDTTSQWDRVGVNRRSQAIEFMKKGYDQQLTFRRQDYSYSANADRRSSTWLTAYVVKVFAMLRSFIFVENDVLCGAIKWLILEKQKPDGLFKEDYPVYHQEMTGAISGSKEVDTTFTAFVLVAMMDAERACGATVNNYQDSIDKGMKFVLDQYPNVQTPYTTAIASYALARGGKLKDTRKLLSVSTGNIHWDERNSKQLSLEATGYALLTLLYLKQFELTGPIVRWIAEQRYYGEVFTSTQATVVTFEALAQYQIDIPTVGNLQLDVSLNIPSRKQEVTHRINLQNALVARTETLKTPEEFVVTAKGKGQGVLTVQSIYYETAKERENKCDNFFLSVTVKEEDDNARKPENVKKSVSITICTKFLKSYDATMSIIDVSMMTGFFPDINDLNRLMNGVDKYISNFEINKGATERGTLIIYLNKVSHTQEECLRFRLHQGFEVGLIQPASVTVYDYYTPENRCTKFYHVDKNSALYSKICQGEVCRCAEGNCYKQQQLKGVTAEKRLESACNSAVDFVYKVKLDGIEPRDNYNSYIMTIVRVIKQGTDENVLQNKRDFTSLVKCNSALNLKIGQEYIIWGIDKDMFRLGSSYSYSIGKDTWIEWWPNDRECQLRVNAETCEHLDLLAETLELIGCPK